MLDISYLCFIIISNFRGNAHAYNYLKICFLAFVLGPDTKGNIFHFLGACPIFEEGSSEKKIFEEGSFGHVYE
jgi:hypothetical protein